MGDTRFWKHVSGENPTCHCELQTLLSYFQEKLWVSASYCQYEEAEGRIFHPAHVGKYGYKTVTIFSDDTDIFVMSLMFQYKISVLLIKQFGTKTMAYWPCKVVATTGI